VYIDVKTLLFQDARGGLLNFSANSAGQALGLIVHSDRGQYASELYQGLLASHGFVRSRSRKANCWDSAVAERFFLNLKMERVWQRHAPTTLNQKPISPITSSASITASASMQYWAICHPLFMKQKMVGREPIVVSEIT
jgi:putative transposase